MPTILTLTMNPALDIATSTDRVTDTHKLRCGPAVLHPGGGGINVARVVHRLGGDCQALFPAGGVTGQRLVELLAAEKVPGYAVAIAGETRESFSVFEASSGRDYRFVLPGPTLSESEWRACLAQLQAHLAQGQVRYLVVSGSLSPGVPVDFCAQLADVARHHGSRLVLDTSGAPLAAALAKGVYLVKPSLRELRDLARLPLATEAEWLAAARQLVISHQAEVVALSLGEDGAMLVTADRTLRAKGIAVKVASSIGAGDSFLGGLIWSLSRTADLEKAFRYAMAAGAAALLSAGTALCQPADVERFCKDVNITPV